MKFNQEKLKQLGIKLAIHLGFIFGFLLLVTVFFSPHYYDDYELPMHDVQMAKGASKEAVDFRQSTGEEALWTGRMFGGMPLYMTNVKNSGNLIKPFHDKVRFLKRPGDTIFLAFLCFYLALISFRAPPVVAFLLGACYAFSTFSIVSVAAGHVYKLLAIAYMPLVLAGFIHVFKKKYILGVVMFMLGLGLELDSKHPQVTYYLLLLLVFVGIYFLVETIFSKEWKIFFKSFGILIISGVLTLLPMTAFIWQSAEYSKYSTRGGTELTELPPGADSSESQPEIGTGLRRDYVFDYSSGMMESFTMLVPNLYGGASGMELKASSEYYDLLDRAGYPIENEDFPNHYVKAPAYWGPQDKGTAGPAYVGAIAFFLFVFGMVVIQSRIKWYILGAFLFFVMLSWGDNLPAFNYFMFDYFPMYNKFRAVSMAVVAATLCLPFVGGLAIIEVMRSESREKLLGQLNLARNIMLGLFAFVLIFGFLSDFTTSAEKDMSPVLRSALKADRAFLTYMDIFRSFVIISAAYFLLLQFLKGRISQLLTFGILAALAVGDMWLVNKRYLNETSFTVYNDPDKLIDRTKVVFDPLTADLDIMKDKSIRYRVFDQNNPFNNGRTSYFHNSIGGYHGAKIRRYQDLIEWYIGRGHQGVLNMLNTKYYIGYMKQGGNRNGESDTAVFRPGSYGNAWFVSELKTVDNATEEIKELDKTDLSSVAVIDIKKFPVSKSAYSKKGEVKLVEYKPNYLKYKSENDQEGYVVFSEIYYPKGWTAYIDGKESKYERVNYVLRGMKVPAGTHTIEFKFEPSSYTTGNTYSLIGSVIFFIVVFGGIGILIRKELLSLE